MAEKVLSLKTLAPYKLKGKRKVRDAYSVPGYEGCDDILLMRVSDRVSVDNKVVGKIEGRGSILNRITIAMKNLTKDIIPNDILVTDEKEILEMYGCSKMSPSLKGRLCIVKAALVIPFECIVRGKLRGSLNRAYVDNGSQVGRYLGCWLPAGMEEGDSFPVPLFTPSTKVSGGDDENITYDQMIELLQKWLDENDICEWTAVGLAQAIRSTSLALFMAIRSLLGEADIEIEDTKFEYGLVFEKLGNDDEGRWVLTLLDEVGTPDSSRIVKNGEDISKQFLRNLIKKVGWAGVTEEDKRTFMENYSAIDIAVQHLSLFNKESFAFIPANFMLN
jgi:phosphoribosylaminoimidazole-succinocarboxamide synthase